MTRETTRCRVRVPWVKIWKTGAVWGLTIGSTTFRTLALEGGAGDTFPSASCSGLRWSNDLGLLNMEDFFEGILT